MLAERHTHARRHSITGWELDADGHAYVRDAGRRFQLLRILLGELSGLLLLESMDAQRSAPIDALERQITMDLENATEALVSRAPPSCRYLHGQLESTVRHLDAAYSELRRATRARRGIALVQRRLTAAYNNLRQVSDVLPGADLVDRAAACCVTPQTEHS